MYLQPTSRFVFGVSPQVTRSFLQNKQTSQQISGITTCGGTPAVRRGFAAARLRATSLMAQRDHGIHTHRSTSRNKTGEQRNSSKHNARRRVRERIEWTDTEKQSGKVARQA